MSGNYLAEGFKRTRKTYKDNKGLIISFIFLSISSIVGKLFFFTAPIFQMFDLSIAEDAAENNEFNMFEAFRDTDNPKSVWILTILNIALAIFLITGISLICLIGGFLYLAGIELELISNIESVRIYFVIPMAILGAVFVSGLLTVFAPVTYIVKNTEKKDLFTVLYNNKISMNLGVIKKIFSINIVYHFVMIGIPTILVILYNEFELSFFGLFFFILCIILYLLLLSNALLTKNIALYLFYKDHISLDQIKIKNVKNQDATSDEQKLSNLFNDSDALN